MIYQESGKRNLVRGTVCTLTKCDFCFSSARFCEADENEAFHRAIERTAIRVAGFHSAHIDDSPFFSETMHFYQMMLRDPEFESAVIRIIQTECVPAPEAVKRHFDRYMALLSAQDTYFRNRCFDIEDLRNLLLESFSAGANDWKISDKLGKHRILILDTLLATDLVRVEFEKFAAVIARNGGMNSHAAILLESAGIPFVILDAFPENTESGTAIQIDFTNGQILIEPDHILAFSGENGHYPMDRCQSDRPLLQKEERQPEVNWFVSLNFLTEAMHFSPETVEGMGLFRTEMMVLSENRFPSELEQFSIYSQIADHFAQKPVFFRLWDIEPDKIPEGLNTTVFGAAFLAQNPELTQKQLRALLQVSMRRSLGITIPMVTDLKEITAIKQLIETAKAEIRKKNPDGSFHVQIGIMVETTALIEQLRQLPKLDYLIIGSNDLVCDRMKTSRHSAGFTPKLFLQMEFLGDLKQIVLNTASSEIPIYLCGEAANHLDAIEMIAKLGIHRFCPSPNGLACFRKQ